MWFTRWNEVILNNKGLKVQFRIVLSLNYSNWILLLFVFHCYRSNRNFRWHNATLNSIFIIELWMHCLIEWQHEFSHLSFAIWLTLHSMLMLTHNASNIAHRNDVAVKMANQAINTFRKWHKRLLINYIKQKSSIVQLHFRLAHSNRAVVLRLTMQNQFASRMLVCTCEWVHVWINA